MSYQKDIFDLVTRLAGTGNILAVPRMFCEMTGSLESGVLLSQIIYWADKGSDPDGWFYKSYVEWYQDSFLSEYQVRKGVKAFEKAGLLEVKLKKVQGSPTLHYRINKAVFSEWILKNLGFQTVKPKDELPNSQCPSIYTETTSEITSETTTTTRDRAPEVGHHRRLAGPETKGEAAPPEPVTQAEPLKLPAAATTRANGAERTRQNDPAYNTICTAIESNGFGLMTPILATTVKTLMDTYPTDWILRALEIAVSSNVIRINYVKGILDNWQREGFGNDNRKYNRERTGNHPAPADDERTSRQRQYNERHTSLMADQINGTITSDEADRRWGELETEFPGFEYEKLP